MASLYTINYTNILKISCACKTKNKLPENMHEQYFFSIAKAIFFILKMSLYWKSAECFRYVDGSYDDT